MLEHMAQIWERIVADMLHSQDRLSWRSLYFVADRCYRLTGAWQHRSGTTGALSLGSFWKGLAMRPLSRIISGLGLAVLTVAMLTVAPGWTADNSPEAAAAEAAAEKCAATAERSAARCEALMSPGTDLNYCLQRVQNRYNACVGNLALKASSSTVKQRPNKSNLMGNGLLDQGSGAGGNRPSAVGTPMAPRAPTGQIIR